MEEKTMVNDVLANVKAELTTYQDVITESANQELRQTVQTIRNGSEAFQYELFKVAQTKGYYKPAAPATPMEVSNVKNELQQ